MPRKPVDSVSEDTLKSLQARGISSPLLETRLAYAEANQILTHYLGPMRGVAKVFPRMCGPQASGRLSVSDPPLINFTANQRYGPKGIRDVVRPDAGQAWVCFDLDAVEARLLAHVCGDKVDGEVFRRELDIHTVTAIRMFKWPDPPFEPTKRNLFGTDAGRAWCVQVATLMGWTQPFHAEHRYRTLVKSVRYCGQYCRSLGAAHGYAVEMGMTTSQLRHFLKLYLDGKPWLQLWKQRTWDECWRAREARTAFGRRRRLTGEPNVGRFAGVKAYRLTVEKEGLNHIIQGTVADLMKQIVYSVCRIPKCLGLAFQTHDGAKFIFPSAELSSVEPRTMIGSLVERTWVLWERPLWLPATFEVVRGGNEDRPCRPCVGTP